MRAKKVAGHLFTVFLLKEYDIAGSSRREKKWPEIFVKVHVISGH